MNISCLQENLALGLQIVRSSIGKDSGLPILSMILLRAEGKFIYLHTTNLEIAIQYLVRGKVEEDGSIAIPAKTFSDFISLLPKEKVELRTENDTLLSLVCKNYQTTIHGMAPDEFPLIPSLSEGKRIECTSLDLKGALGAAAQAAATQEIRPELHGVYLWWRAQEKKLYCVGTDAYRLSEKSIPAQGDSQEDITCIVPLRTIQELSRNILRDDGGQCEIVVTENQIMFKMDGCECVSKIVQGSFPDYQSIIPSTFFSKILIDREELVRAVKATSLFSRGGLNDVICHIEPRDQKRGIMTLSSANSGVGENKVTLECELTGGENGITLNFRYLLDGLSHMESEHISIGVVDTQNPCVLRPVGDETFMYLIMPIRE